METPTEPAPSPNVMSWSTDPKDIQASTKIIMEAFSISHEKAQEIFHVSRKMTEYDAALVITFHAAARITNGLGIAAAGRPIASNGNAAADLANMKAWIISQALAGHTVIDLNDLGLVIGNLDQVKYAVLHSDLLFQAPNAWGMAMSAATGPAGNSFGSLTGLFSEGRGAATAVRVSSNVFSG